MRRAALTLAVAVAFAGLGCGHRLVKLHARGEHGEVVARASAARWLPRDRAARAWAGSLVALGRVEEARGVLAWDFRHGGHRRSLLQLAELERAQGLDGMAATRFARLVTIDPHLLAGRADVCDLFVARARALADLGESLAAHADLRRVAILCGAPTDEAERLRRDSLAERVRGTGERLARAERAPVDVADPIGVSAPRIESAAIEPALVVRALADELTGASGPGMLSDPQLRRLAGEREWDAFAAAVAGQPAEVAAYATLRLSAIRPAALGEGDPLAARQALAGRVAGAVDGAATAGAWRALAALGDPAGAELALASVLRRAIPIEPAVPPRRGATPEPSPAELDAPGAHWSARVPVDATTAVDLLALARFLLARDRPERALVLGRRVLAASSAGLDPEQARARGEVWWALELGRPFHALALAEAAGGEVLADARTAAAASVRLAEVACGAACLAEDRAVAEAVMGAAWVQAERAALVEVPRAATPAPLRPGCPAMAELLATDAVGPVAQALARRLEAPADPKHGARSLRAIEADVSMSCAIFQLVPGLSIAEGRVGAGTLSERLAHAPELVASAQLEAQALVALAADDPERAWTLVVAAAAAAADPRAVYLRAALAGRRADARELELAAWVRAAALLHGEARLRAQWAMTLVHLRDAATSVHLREGGPTRAALRKAVVDLATEAGAREFSVLEELGEELARLGPWDATAVEVLRAALWPDEAARQRHAAVDARLSAAPAELARADAFAFDRARPGGELPTGVALARDGSAQALRLDAALAAPPGEARMRALVGLAVAGDEPIRTRALAALVPPGGASRAALGRVLVSGLFAAGAGLRPEPLVSEDAAVVRVLFR